MEIKQITAENVDIDQLANLLIDAVNSGASIGFIAPLTVERAKQYWSGVLQALSSRFILLGAFDNETLVGSIQLECSGKENAFHRAEVQKLFVLRSHRGKGIAKKLMTEVESIAKNLDRFLLFLDTKLGDDAEQLYGKIGYIRAGVIPEFAADSGGGFAATVLFYKKI